MNKNKLENINKRYPSKKDKPQSEKSVAEFRIIEDRKDLSLLASIAAQGTKKGFEKAKKIAHEIVIVQNGKLIRKRPGKPNELISKLEERRVEIGKTISL